MDMRRWSIIAILLLCMISVGRAGWAQGETSLLSIDLAEQSVDITTGFNGVHLKLFGVKDGDGDVAIVISGPHKDMTVRKKQKVFGVWTNVGKVRFKGAPIYYDYALSNPALEGTQQGALTAQGIGMETLRFPAKKKMDEQTLKTFQDALIRNKQMEGRYPKEATQITFLRDNFFKTSFYIPSNVPKGDYTIQSFLIDDGEVRDINTTNVRVGQVGVSARIYNFANNNGLLYGISCVIFAMFMGWLSTFVRRRA